MRKDIVQGYIRGFWRLPRVPLSLSLNRAVRQRSPDLCLALLPPLVLAVVVLSNSSSLLLQDHADVGPGRAQDVDLALCAVLGQLSVRPSADPGLVNVHGGGVGDGVSLAVLEADVDGLGRVGDGGLAETHATGDNGLVAGVLEVVENGDGGLFLAEAQLNNGVVDGLAGDLAGNGAQLLDAGLDVFALAVALPLGALDEHFLVQAAALADVAHEHFALPALARHRVGVEDCRHGGEVAAADLLCCFLFLCALLDLAVAFEDGGFGQVTALYGGLALL